MAELHEEILTILAEEQTRVVSVAYVLEELDLRGVSFEMGEFDGVLKELEEGGHIRIMNKTDPQNDWQLKLRSRH